MRRALGAKMKFEFFDGSIPMATDPFDPLYRPWNRCNMLIHSWIINFVDPSIRQSIVFMENAANDSRTVTEFLSELKILWEELEINMPVPTCTCRVKCGCEAMRTARRNHQLLHSMRFITGLNDYFGVVKSQILLLDPLPPINKIFSMILQHERQIPTVSDDSKAIINISEIKKSNQRTGRFPTKPKPRICTHCNRTGHTIDTCYKKHGLPPHLQRSTSSSSHGNPSEGSTFVVSDARHDSNSNTPSLSHEQYENIINLLQSSGLNQQLGNVASNQVTTQILALGS
ncbi:uncharacterized protein LOC131618618 [Vicia villosa]|uniref:uncharacterized protein LOC131618618 n=1 Tax=Vicia villosa TaxID=3911 RepID=UPI00273B5CBF|nr:uncharacterized protein LOC131618618 [Vicia villosa]